MRHSRHTCIYRCFIFVFGFLFFSQLNGPLARGAESTDTQYSHPGIGQESRYAEAVLAYNKKKTSEAIRILDELLKETPDRIQYLELKALALKGKGDEKSSLELYQKLYQSKPEEERGPYAYEIASLLEKQKKSTEAKPYFLESAKLDFNRGPSYLVLGVNAFKQTFYAEAESYFNEITRCGVPEIELLARYYSSLCFFKLNLSTRGIQELVDARDQADRLVRRDAKNENAKTILNTSIKMLAPFSDAKWFGTAAILTQYDSNIQQLPAATSNTVAVQNEPTLKTNVLGNLGYMSAPSNTFQVVTGYRATFNKNFNQALSFFEYFTNNLSFFLNYRPLARTTYSLKVESNFIFQNSIIDPTSSTPQYEYQKYNFTLGGGFIARHQVSRNWRLEGEVNFRRLLYYADNDQSGQNYNVILSARSTGGGNYFNPGFSVLFEKNVSVGTFNYYQAIGGGFSNTMTFANQFSLTQNLDFLYTDYTRTNPYRDDFNIGLRIGAIKMLSAKWSLMGDVNYIRNSSNIPESYTYNRFLTSLGVGYSF